MNREVSDLIDRMETQGLLDPSVLANLRNEVRALPHITPLRLVKVLVDKGQLTHFQATNLITWLNTEAPAAAEKKTPAAAEKKTSASPAPKASPPESGEAPQKTETRKNEPARRAPAPTNEQRAANPPAPADADEELQLVDDDRPLPSVSKPPTPAKASGEGAAGPPLAGKSGAGKGGRPKAAASESGPHDDLGELVPLEEPSGLEPIKELGELEPIEDNLFGDAAALPSLDELAPDPLGSASNEALAGGVPTRFVRRGKSSWWRQIFGSSSGKGSGNPWESPLILLGGGGLVVLILVGLLLFFSIHSVSSEEMWGAAEELYAAQSYTQAIEKYERFEAAFPNDANASKSRVRRHMAQLRAAVEGTKNWPQALSVAREILPRIEAEEKFSEARDELSSLLPDVAFGLLAQARDKTDDTEPLRKLLEQALQAMDLVNNPVYIPSGLRKSQETRIEEIEHEIASIRRNVNRVEELSQTESAMLAAVERGQPLEAYVLRKSLLAKYPSLETAPSLRESLAKVAASLRALCRVETEIQLAKASGKNGLLPVVVAPKRGGNAEFAKGVRFHVTVNGAVYALDGATGRVLWRRFVGRASMLQPVSVNRKPDGDLLVVDAGNAELVRLASESGEVVWRFQGAAALGEPAPLRDKILIATGRGELHQIDAATGNSLRRAKLPQAIEAPPAFDQLRPIVYQLGDHSNLFALDAESLECLEVLHLGHASGSITQQPTMMLGRLLMAENVGLDYSLVRVVAVNAEGREMRESQPPLRLPGRILSPPVPLDRSVLFITDRGSVHVLSIEPASEKDSVKIAAQIPATFPRPVIGYGVQAAGRLWIGDSKLSRYDLQTNLGKLARKWIKHDGAYFLAPPVVKGAGLFCLARPEGSVGVTATLLHLDPSADAKTDGVPIWETRLGVPSATAPLAFSSGDKFIAMNTDGALLAIDKAPQVEKPVQAALSGFEATNHLRVPSFQGNMETGDASLVLCDRRDPRHFVIVESKPTGPEATRAIMRVPEGALASSPSLFANRLLVPLLEGRVELHERNGVASKTLPFQPATAAGSSVHWTRPLVVPGNPQEFLIGDDRGQLFLVGVAKGSVPSLIEKAKATFEGTLAAGPGLAAAAGMAYLSVKQQDASVILPFSLPALETQEPISLSGGIAWGPERVGEGVFLVLDGGQLVSLFGGKRKWLVDDVGPLAGPPAILADGSLIVATLAGKLIQLDGSNGQKLKEKSMPEPLGSGPTIVNGELYVFGVDGSLFTESQFLAP